MNPVKLHAEMTSTYPPGVANRLADSTVGIAGAGGLGTAVALSLARACVGRLIIVDFDVVEARNLNRQHYFVDQVGMPKVDALKENLERINPWVELTVHNRKIVRGNVEELFGDADVVVEAFDLAQEKLMLIESCMIFLPGKHIVAASGLAGYGKNEDMCTQRTGTLSICGDMKTEVDVANPPIAPRVGVVANMQANRVLEILLDGVERKKTEEG
jgi:sulfur carrier protein ThiS adenylyltransferase